MRHVLALFALSVLVPSTALADDDDAQPSSHDTAPTSPTPTIQREFPSQSKPDTSQAVTTEAAAPRAVTSPASTSSDSDEDMGGYVVPHFVPYLGGEIPQYAHIETKPNFGLVAAGAVTLGTPYFISLIYALSTCGAQMDCRSGSGWLYLPVVGPFITAAQSQTTGGAALAAFDGGIQVLGAALAIAGVAAPRKFVVWQNKDKAASISVTPTSPGPMAAGLAVTLTNL